MFALTESLNYYLCPRYVNMCSGINALSVIVRNDLKRNPVSGEVFLFVNKSRTIIKLLHWEKGGFVLYQKRLEEGTFEIPCFDPGSGRYQMKWESFFLMMEGVSLKSARFRKRFKGPV